MRTAVYDDKDGSLVFGDEEVDRIRERYAATFGDDGLDGIADTCPSVAVASDDAGQEGIPMRTRRAS